MDGQSQHYIKCWGPGAAPSYEAFLLRFRPVQGCSGLPRHFSLHARGGASNTSPAHVAAQVVAGPSDGKAPPPLHHHPQSSRRCSVLGALHALSVSAIMPVYCTGLNSVVVLHCVLHLPTRTPLTLCRSRSVTLGWPSTAPAACPTGVPPPPAHAPRPTTAPAACPARLLPPPVRAPWSTAPPSAC
jgi:hypothetical protein